jgi:hypothetical protein
MAAGAVALAFVLVLAACPSLAGIGVGASPDASSDPRMLPMDGGSMDADADDALVTCDADAASDPHNCGQCGHDCLDADCISGQCQPMTLYTGNTPISIVVDGPTLCVAVQTELMNDGYVFRCAIDGCEQSEKILAGSLEPWFLAKQGTKVYWANFGGSDPSTSQAAS